MCVVSMVTDTWINKWEQEPRVYPEYQPFQPDIGPASKEDLRIKKLEEDVQFLKEQIKAAKEYDKENEEPHCEDDEKIEQLRQIFKELGIDVDPIIELIRG